MFVEYAWTIPLFPFLAFLIITAFRGRLPAGGAPTAVLGVLLSLGMSLGVLWEVLTQHATHETHFRWMTLGEHEFTLGILVDNLSAFMAALVSFLSSLIVIYSIAYMRAEGPRRPRYFLEITLFISGMLGTVLSGDFLVMFVSWEIMGLCSYLLIGYWFERPSAASAAKKAFLVTRVGDVSLILGLLILWYLFGTFNYREIFEATDLIQANTGLVFIANLLIFGGAVGKSAQFPLHVWLPDAMEGPTTVSALIHAATMVKGGVFLVARSFPLYVHTPDVFLWIAVLGAITAFMAATMALVQFDIKRVLAYSTLSQLGYMFLALGAGGLLAVELGSSQGYTGALLHLMNHAFFKALLFLGAGSVILGMHHTNDLRQMGGLHRKMPITSWTMLLGSLSIAGIPLLSGFWSKDEVLAAAYEAAKDHPVFLGLWALGVATALLTAFYMFRMWFMAFTGNSRSEASKHAHESPGVMTTPLVILAFFAVVSGLFLFAGFAQFQHFDASEYLPGTAAAHEATGGELLLHILTDPLTYVSVALVLFGVFFAYRVYVRQRPHPDQLTAPLLAHDAHKLLTNLYYYDKAFMTTGQAVGVGLAKASDAFDRWVVDGAVRGVGWVSVRIGRAFSLTQTGRVTNYAGAVIAGVTALLVSLVWILIRLGGA